MGPTSAHTRRGKTPYASLSEPVEYETEGDSFLGHIITGDMSPLQAEVKTVVDGVATSEFLVD